ncbi:MAG: DUF1285 domain-containing protein [Alphaproteobacteria bacterium]|nr:DUF1285 domain-containing protein [Alphaproteobacteria bacterium]
MKDLMRYAAALEGEGGKSFPPVHKWHPEHCGDIDIVIKRDGTWFHEGTPIGRARLVRLFSTVLRRDGEDYVLVTPVEKMRITVEDVPFIAVLMRVEGEDENQRLIFTSNVGDEVVAGPGHALDFRKGAKPGEDAPYINIRAGLEARIARAVFYDLVALGKIHHIDGSDKFGVWSQGVFFPFGDADEVFV